MTPLIQRKSTKPVLAAIVVVYVAASAFWLTVTPDPQYALMAFLSGPPACLAYWPSYWGAFVAGTLLVGLALRFTVAAKSTGKLWLGVVLTTLLWVGWGCITLSPGA